MYIPILYVCFRGYQIGRPGEPSPWLKILNETTRTRKPLPAGTLCTEHMCSRRREKQVDSCAMSCSVHSTPASVVFGVTYSSSEPGEPSPLDPVVQNQGDGSPGSRNNYQSPHICQNFIFSPFLWE